MRFVSGRKGTLGILTHGMAASSAVIALCAPAWAGPEGERVVSGAATVVRSGPNTAITAANNTIINFTSFDIARHETVNFIQPSAAARVFNNVDGGNLTQIAGTLTSNGIVYLMNPAGIYFREGAIVNVGGIYAGAAHLSDADFLRGQNHFTNASGAVVNEGTITGQTVALFGREVANRGAINSPGGTVVMAAGENIYVGERGGRIFVQVDAAHGASSGGTPATPGVSVEQAGTINARAGRVSIAAGDMYSMAIRHTGATRARDVRIEGAGKGNVLISGLVDASGPGGAGQQRGGEINITGERIAVSAASVTASGAAGGGVVNIGGEVYGGGSLRHSTSTVVMPDANITADGTGAGAPGGQVAIWSDAFTGFYGRAYATGQGRGGMVETSSQGALAVGGVASAGGRTGGGEWLLDPANVSVLDLGSPGTTPVTPNPFDPTGTGAQVNVQAIKLSLEGDLGSGGSVAPTDVTITTFATGVNPNEAGNITWSAPLTVNIGAGTTRTLTLRAANNIVISANSAIDASTGGAASGLLNINLFANDGQNGALTQTQDAQLTLGTVTVNSALRSNGGAITLGKITGSRSSGITTAAAGVLDSRIGTTAAGGGAVRIESVGPTGVTLNGPITTGGGTFTIDTTALLTSSANVILNATATVNAGTFTINTVTANSRLVRLNSIVNATSLSVTTNRLDFNSSGTIANLQITTTGGSQSYSYAATTPDGSGLRLSGNTTLTATGATSDITFDSNFTAATINGARGLTINAGRDVIFSTSVGNTAESSRPTFLDVTAAGTILFNQGIVQTSNSAAGDPGGRQTYTGTVRIAADTEFKSTSGATLGTITFNSAVAGTSNGGQGLTVTGNGVFAAALGTNATRLRSILVSGTTAFNAPSAFTTGDQTYTGAFTLGNSSATLTGVNVLFAGTVNADNATTFDRALTVNASGNTAFNMPVGGSANGALFSLTTDSAGTSSFKSVATEAGGFQSYADQTATLNGTYTTGGGAFAIGGNTSLAGTTVVNGGAGGVTFTGAVSGAQALTVNSSASTVFNSTVSVASLLTDGGGGAGDTTTLRDAATTSGSQTYNDAVLLGWASGGANVRTLSGSSVSFARAVDNETNAGRALTVNSSGATLFSGAVGAGANGALDSLTTDNQGGGAGETTTFAANVSVSNALTVNDAALLTGAGTRTMSAGSATFAQTVRSSTGGQSGLSLTATTGAAQLQGVVGGNSQALASLTVNANTAASSVGATTTGAQSYTGPTGVSLSGDYATSNASFTVNSNATLTGNTTVATGGGDATFKGTVVAAAADTQTLQLTLGAGSADFQQAVGTGAALGGLTLVSAGNAGFAAALSATDVVQQAGTGTTTFTGLITTTGATGISLTGTNFAINGGAAVSSTGGIAVNNAGTLTIGATALNLTGTGGFSQTSTAGTGTVALNGSTINTNDRSIGFASNVSLATGAVVVNTTTGNTGNITFTGTVTGGQALTATSGGTTTFNSAVGAGAGNALTSLTVDGGGTTNVQSVTTTGGQSYADGTVTLNGTYTVNSGNAGTAAFSVNDAGAGTANTVLAGNTTINAGAGAITFEGTVNSAANGGNTASLNRTLTANSTGATMFTSAVGTGTNGVLGSLTTDAGGTSSLGSVATTGAQSYADGTVTLNGTYTTSNASFSVSDAGAGTANTVLAGNTTISAGAGAITFEGTVNADASANNRTLAANSTGAATFAGAVGGGANGVLASLSTDSGGTSSLQSVTTTGGQSYADGTVNLNGTYTVNSGNAGTAAFSVNDAGAGTANTVLAGNTTINAGAGAITFEGTVNSAANGGNTASLNRTLTANSTGATMFTSAVGTGTNGVLGSLTTDAGGTSSLGSVATTGAQSYADGTVTLNGTYTTSNASFSVNDAGAGTANTVLGGNTAIATGGGNVLFEGTVNGTSANGQTLGITAGGGSITLQSAAGGGGAATALGDVTVVSAGDVGLQALTAANLVQQAGTGTTTLSGLATTTGATGISLTGTNFAINGGAAVSSTGGIAVNNSGTLTINNAALNITGSGAFAQTGAGGTTLANSTINTNEQNIGFNGPATLTTGTTTLSTGPGAGGNITFTGTLNSDAGNRNLTLGGRTGTLTFGSAVGGAGAATALGDLTIADATTVNANSTVRAANVVQQASTGGGTSTFTGLITTTGATGISLTGTNFAINGGAAVSSTGGIAVNNAGTLTIGATALNLTGTGGFSQTSTAGTGTVALNGSTINTNDRSIGFASNVGLATGAVVVNTTTGNTGNITFNGTVTGGQALTATSGGTTTFNSAVGAGAGNALTSLTVDGGGTTNVLSVTTTGGQSYADGTVTLNGTYTVNSGNAGTAAFSVNNAAAGAGNIANATLLGATAVNAGGGNITFENTIAGGGVGLALNSSGGATSVGGAISNVSSFDTDLAGTAGGTSSFNGIATTGGGSITLRDTTITLGGTYNSGGGNFTVQQGAAITSVLIPDGTTTITTTGGGTALFQSTINGVANAGNLAVNAAGLTTFGSSIGNSTRLATLTTGGGNTTLFTNLAAGASAGTTIQTTGLMNFGDAVQLAPLVGNANADYTFSANGASAQILFADLGGSATHDTQGLIIAAGTPTFGGTVGTPFRLKSILFTGTLNLLADTTYTLGSTPITLGAVNGSGGNRSFTINTSGLTTLNGAFTNINNFTANGGGETCTSVDLTIAGAFTFTDDLCLAGAVGSTRLLQTTGNGQTFSFARIYSDTGGARGIEVATSNGVGNLQLYTGEIGGERTAGDARPLSNFITDGVGATDRLGGNITTTAGSTVAFGHAIELTSNVTITGPGTGAYTLNFLGTVQAPTTARSLTVNSAVGTTTFVAAVGGGGNPLASLSTNNATVIGGNVTTTSVGGGTGNQSFAGAATVSGAGVRVFTGTNVSFGSTLRSAVNGTTGVSVVATGATTFTGAVGDNSQRLASLSTDSGGTSSLGSVATTGAQSYADGTVTLNGTYTTSNASFSVNDAGAGTANTVLGGNTAIATGGGNVLFEGTVNGTSANGQTLGITAGGGSITLQSAAGGGGAATALGDVTVVSAGDVGLQALTAANLVQQAGTGTTTLSGLITTTGATGISLTGTNFAINGGAAVSSTGGIAVNNSGTLTINNAALNITGSGAFAQTGAGGTTLANSTINTNEQNIGFNGPATLTTGTTTLSTGPGAGGNITFTGTLNSDAGNRNLTLGGRTGTLTFGSAVGGAGVATALGDLTIADATAVNANSTVRAANVVQQASTGGGTSTFTGLITTTGATGISLTGTNFAINGGAAVSSTGGIAVNNAGTLTIGATALNLTGTGGFSQTSTAGTGTVALNGSTINTNDRSIGFASNVGLATGAVVVNTTTGNTGNITFNGTVTGGQALTATSGGTTTFNSAVGAGAGNALTSLTVDGGGTTNVQSVTTTGGQSYADGTVNLNGTYTVNSGNAGTAAFSVNDAGAGTANTVLAGNTTINAGAGAITFEGTVNSAANGGNTASLNRTLTANSTGATMFTSAVGTGTNGVLGSLSTDSGGTSSLGSVATTGAQSYADGTVTLNGTYTTSNASFSVNDAGAGTANTVLGGNTAIATGGGNVLFEGTVNGTSANGQTLGITAGGGSITLQSAAGGGGAATALGDVTVVSAGDVGLQALTAANLVQQAGTGTTTLSGLITTTGATGISLTGTNFAMSGGAAVSSTGGITVANTGTLTINNAALNITGTGAFSQTGAGGTTLANSTINTNDRSIGFASNVSLATGAVVVNTTTGNTGNITFNGTVTGGQALTATSGGTTTFNAAVGAGAGNALASLTVDGGGTTLITNGSSVTTSGNQTYADRVILGNTPAGADYVLTANAGSLIAFTSNSAGAPNNNSSIDGTVANQQGLTINGAGASFTGLVGANTALEFVALNGGLTLAGDTVLNLGATPITLVGATGPGGGAALTVTTSGLTTITGAFTNITNYTSNGGGMTCINVDLAVSNNFTFDDSVCIGGSLNPSFVRTLTAGNAVAFNSTVDSEAAAAGSTRGLAVVATTGAGTVLFNQAVGASAAGVGQTARLRTLTVNANTTTLGGDVNTEGDQTYTTATRLAAGVIADVSAGGGVAFNGTVDNATGTARALTVNTAGGGTTTFGGAVGGGANGGLLSIATNADGTTSIAADVTTTGTQMYADNATLTGAGTRTFAASGVTFSGTLDSAADGVTGAAVNTSGGGATVFGGLVGGGVGTSTSRLASLTTNADGTVSSVGVRTTSGGGGTGAIAFNETGGGGGASTQLQGTYEGDTFSVAGAAGLTGATTVNVSGTGGTVLSFATIDGAASLTTSAPNGGVAAVSVFGAIGSGTALTSVDLTGRTLLLDGSATTSGDQTYTSQNARLGGASYRTTGTNNTITFNAPINLNAANVELRSVNGAISVNGGNTIEANTDGQTTNLTITSAGAFSALGGIGVNRAITSLTTDTAGSSTLGSVATTGAQSYADGTVTLNGTYTTSSASFSVNDAGAGTANTVLGGNTAIATGGGNVLFEGTVNGTSANGQTLGITAGGGSITLQSAAGGGGAATALGDVTVVSAGDVGLQALTAANLVQQAGTGTTTLSGLATTTGATGISLTGTNFAINGGAAVSSTGGIAVNNSGTLTINNAALNITGSGAFAQTGAGGTTLANSTINTNEQNIGFNGPATLTTGTTTLSTGPGAGGNITFTGTLNSDAGNRNLTLGGRTGTLTFGSAVGGAGVATALGDLTIADATTVNANSTVRAANVAQQASTGAGTSTFTGLVTTTGGTGISLTGTNFAVNGGAAVSSTGGITVANSGTLTINNAALNITGTGAFSQTGAGGTTLANSAINTNEQNIGFNGPVTLTTGTTTLSTGPGAGGNITFTGTLNSDAGNRNLTLGGRTGTVTFNSAVGGAGAATALGDLTIADATTVNANSTVRAANVAQQASTGAGTSTFTGLATTTGATGISLTGTNFAINGGAAVSSTGGIAVNNSGTLTINNAALNITGSGAFAQTGAGGTTLANSTINTNEQNIGFNGPATLTTGTTTLSTGPGAGGNITFTGTLNSDAGNRNLTLGGRTGTLTFGSAVGGAGVATALGDLTIADATTVNANSTVRAANVVQQASTGGGTSTFTGLITTTGATGISLTGTNFAINGGAAVSSTGGIAVNNAGTLTIGATALNLTGTGGFSQTSTAGTGTVALNGSTINTNDRSIGFASNVSLATGAVVVNTTTGNTGNITFTGTVTGGQALTATSGGTTTFNSAVGAGAGNALTSLTTDASGTTILRDAVTTSGAQTYNDGVLLGWGTGAANGRTLTGSGVSFVSTLNNEAAGGGVGRALTVNTTGGGTTTFGGVVGGGANGGLFSITTNADGTTRIGSNITIGNGAVANGAEALHFGDNVVLTGDALLNAGNGRVFFGGTINSDGTARALRIISTASSAAPTALDLNNGDQIRSFVAPFTFAGDIGNTSPLSFLGLNVGGVDTDGTLPRNTVPAISTILFTDAASFAGGVFNPQAPGAHALTHTVNIAGGGTFAQGQNEKVLATGNLTINTGTAAAFNGTAFVGDVVATGAFTLNSANIRVRSRAAGNVLGITPQPGSVNTQGRDEGVNFVAGTSINFSSRPIRTTGGFTAPGVFAPAMAAGTTDFAAPDTNSIIVAGEQNGDVRRRAYFGGGGNQNQFVAEFMDTSTSGTQPATQRFLPLTRRAQGPTNENVSETLTPFTVVDVPQLQPETSIGQALRAELEQISVNVRANLPAELVEFLLGRSLYIDKPDAARVSSSDRRVSEGRLSVEAVTRVIQSYKAVDAKAGESRAVLEDVAAFNVDVDFDAVGIAEFLMDQPADNPARLVMDELVGLLADVGQLGLGPIEERACKERIVAGIRPTLWEPGQMVAVIEAYGRAKAPKPATKPAPAAEPAAPTPEPAALPEAQTAAAR